MREAEKWRIAAAVVGEGARSDYVLGGSMALRLNGLGRRTVGDIDLVVVEGADLDAAVAEVRVRLNGFGYEPRVLEADDRGRFVNFTVASHDPRGGEALLELTRMTTYAPTAVAHGLPVLSVVDCVANKAFAYIRRRYGKDLVDLHSMWKALGPDGMDAALSAGPGQRAHAALLQALRDSDRGCDGLDAFGVELPVAEQIRADIRSWAAPAPAAVAKRPVRAAELAAAAPRRALPGLMATAALAAPPTAPASHEPAAQWRSASAGYSAPAVNRRHWMPPPAFRRRQTPTWASAARPHGQGLDKSLHK